MAGFKVVYTESKFVKEMYVINISLHEISKVGFVSAKLSADVIIVYTIKVKGALGFERSYGSIYRKEAK